MWRHNLNMADVHLSGAAAPPCDCEALVLAYQSLLLRMRPDSRGALRLAERAIALKNDCFEAHAAKAMALLTGPSSSVEEALSAYHRSDKCVPADAEGHVLRVLLFFLFFEMLMNADDDGRRVHLALKLTPLVRGAVRLLDGYPEIALKEFSADSSGLCSIGQGLSYYRLSRSLDANRTWKVALEGSQQTGKFILSVKYLMLQTGRS